MVPFLSLLALSSLCLATTALEIRRTDIWEVGHLEFSALNATVFQQLPQCSKTCLRDILPRHGCSINIADCLCKNANLTADVETCIASTCTIGDSLATEKFRATACGVPIRDRGGLSRRLNWAMFVVATLFVIGRFASRAPSLGGAGYSWDDWVVLFCYVLLVPTDVSAEIEVQNGLGMDMYMLTVPMIVTILQWFYLGELFYNIIVMGTKASLVLLYLRIWPVDSVSRAFRTWCWILFGVLTATGIVGAFVIIFQCSPVSLAWRSITGEVEGHCIQLTPFTYTYAAVNIMYDIVVLLLPVHRLLKLNIPWPKKVGVCSVFLVGFLVTICSIVRLQYLVNVQHSQNITWDFQYIGMWSLVEANFSVVCCCMPAMAGLVHRIYTKSFGSVQSTFFTSSRSTKQRLMTSERERSLPAKDSNTITDTEMQVGKGKENTQDDVKTTDS